MERDASCSRSSDLQYPWRVRGIPLKDLLWIWQLLSRAFLLTGCCFILTCCSGSIQIWFFRCFLITIWRRSRELIRTGDLSRIADTEALSVLKACALTLPVPVLLLPTAGDCCSRSWFLPCLFSSPSRAERGGQKKQGFVLAFMCGALTGWPGHNICG